MKNVLLNELPHPEDTDYVSVTADNALYTILVSVRYWMADKAEIVIKVPNGTDGITSVEHHAEQLCKEFDYEKVLLDMNARSLIVNLIP